MIAKQTIKAHHPTETKSPLDLLKEQCENGDGDTYILNATFEVYEDKLKYQSDELRIETTQHHVLHKDKKLLYLKEVTLGMLKELEKEFKRAGRMKDDVKVGAFNRVFHRKCEAVYKTAIITEHRVAARLLIAMPFERQYKNNSKLRTLLKEFRKLTNE